MKNLKTQKFNILPFMLALLFLTACSKMDEYKKFTDGKEILYIGKADSVKVLAGRNRLALNWLLISDPKVSKVKIFWDNDTKMLEVPIMRGKGIDTITTIIPGLEEGYYAFKIYTYDVHNNTSVPVEIAGTVYGTIYESSLSNRAVRNVVYDIGGELSVDWFDADSTSLGTEVHYVDKSGQEKSVFVKNTSSKTVLSDFDLTKSLEYRSLFKPESSAIDTFFAEKTVRKIDEIRLANVGPVFIGTNVSGRWGNLADWDINIAAKNHNGIGGFDNRNNGSGFLSFEYWGTPSITNGKISQTLRLPKGNYRFIASISNIDNTLEASYVAVASGATLPDVEEMSTSLGYYKLINNQLNNKDVTVNFSVSEEGGTTLGFVSTMLQNHPTSLRISKVRLYKD